MVLFPQRGRLPFAKGVDILIRRISSHGGMSIPNIPCCDHGTSQIISTHCSSGPLSKAEDFGCIHGAWRAHERLPGRLCLAKGSGATCCDVQRRVVHTLWGLLAGQRSWLSERIWAFSGVINDGGEISELNGGFHENILYQWWFSPLPCCITGGYLSRLSTFFREGVLESWWAADRGPVRTKDNSIIMPDVSNFTERHFQHFQRSAGHTSSGETLLYEATNCQNYPVRAGFRICRQRAFVL